MLKNSIAVTDVTTATRRRDVAATTSTISRNVVETIFHTFVAAGIGVALMVSAIAAGGCDVKPAINRLEESRRLSADLLVQFTKAADAANRAVMAERDELSVAFAAEAEQAKQAVQSHMEALAPILKSLGYTDEIRLLEDFASRFAEYRALDRTILELAVENTNLKAQRLAFGPAQDEADAVKDALEALASRDAADSWRVKALAMTAVAAVREIQVLQAPHIADADDAEMARMEKRMEASDAAARSALATLALLVQPAARSRLAAASAALDRLMEINAQLVALSRRNTNVRSLALSLNEKGKATAECERTLHALRDALVAREFGGRR